MLRCAHTSLHTLVSPAPSLSHNRFISHFDFSDNSAYIQSNCGAYELLFFNTNDGSEVLAPSALKDEVWASQTCVLGWSVQGLWPELTDGIEINGSDRSHDGKYLVRFPDPTHNRNSSMTFVSPSFSSSSSFSAGCGRQQRPLAHLPLPVLETRICTSSLPPLACARSLHICTLTFTHFSPISAHRHPWKGTRTLVTLHRYATR